MHETATFNFGGEKVNLRMLEIIISHLQEHGSIHIYGVSTESQSGLFPLAVEFMVMAMGGILDQLGGVSRMKGSPRE